MTTAETSLAMKIRHRRVELGLSQQELGDLAGVARDSVGNLETGKTVYPRPTTLRAIVRALETAEGLSPDGALAEVKAITEEPAPAGPAVIRMVVEGLYGKTLTIETPVDQVAVLDRLIDRVMSNMREDHAATGTEGSHG